MGKPDNAEPLGSTAVKVLMALTWLYEVKGRVTMREICAEIGINLSTCAHHLRLLKHLGYVTWVPKTGGTLRPLLTVTAVA